MKTMHASVRRRLRIIFDAKCRSAAVLKRSLVTVALLTAHLILCMMTLQQSTVTSTAPAQRFRQSTERPHSDRSDECRDGWLQTLARSCCEAKSRALAFVRAPPYTRVH